MEQATTQVEPQPEVEAQIADDPFGIESIELPEPQPDEALQDDGPEAQAEEGQPEEDQADQDEPESGEPEEKPRKRNASTRISELSQKLKDKDAEMEELKRKVDNLSAAKDYFDGDKKTEAPDLDAQLIEAAKHAGDNDFDIEDFSTDAEKKIALRGYKTEIKQSQREEIERVYGVRDQYVNAVEQLKADKPEVANGLIHAYQAAVADEARAIMYRFDMPEAEAKERAEQVLLADAANRKNPVEHIAKYGYQILKDAQAYLPQKQESARIDHKGREAAQQRAGKPEIDSAPASKMTVQDIQKEFAEIDF